MNLITFDKTTKKPIVRHSKPFLTVTARGKFNFSQGARRLLGIREGDRIIIHQNSVFRSDWYIEITRDEKGYMITQSKTDSRFTVARMIVEEIFKSIGRKPQKTSFLILNKPTVFGNLLLWTIDLKHTI